MECPSRTRLQPARNLHRPLLLGLEAAQRHEAAHGPARNVDPVPGLRADGQRGPPQMSLREVWAHRFPVWGHSAGSSALHRASHV